ncbi:MAG: hypothetical protein HFJ27_01470 [Clostridia bacterium]|nr:hypothetical protein [Clostridia bacterium]
MIKLVDSFSNRLSEIIRLKNIRPIELSEKTGIDKSKISSYMSRSISGKAKWGFSVISMLRNKPCLAYGV